MNQINKAKIHKLQHEILDLQNRVKDFDPNKKGQYEAIFKIMKAIKQRKKAIKVMEESNNKYTNEDIHKEFQITSLH